MPQPDDYAIVVGINDYDPRTNPLRQLQGCVNDAQFFVQWLLDPLGGGLDPSPPKQSFKPDWRIKTFFSPAPTPQPDLGILLDFKPTRDSIEDAMIELVRCLRNTGRPVGRRLYLWFSGHGVTPQREANECAALMANAHEEAPGRNIPGVRFADFCRTAGMFNEVVLFMDCCRGYSGLNDTSLSFITDIRNGTPTQNECYGFATATSSTAREMMLPDPDGQNPGHRSIQGVFAHSVIDGLYRAADRSQGDAITPASLERFVKARMRELQGEAQLPDFPRKQAAISFGPARNKTEVRVTLIEPAKGFQVRDNEDQAFAVAQTQNADGTVSVWLPFGLYLFAVPAVGDFPYERSRFVKILQPEVVIVPNL